MDKIIKVLVPGPISFFKSLDAAGIEQYFFSLDKNIDSIQDVDDRLYIQLEAISLPFYYQTESFYINIIDPPKLNTREQEVEWAFKEFKEQVSCNIKDLTCMPGKIDVI